MPSKINTVFDELRASGRLCDVTLKVGNKLIPAHRVILSGCSPYFLAMFTSSCLESREKTVTLPVFDEDAVEAIVHFAYKNEIDINSDNVQMLLATATILQVTEIKKLCCDFIVQRLDSSNCLGVREFADKYTCTELYAAAHEYTIELFEDVVQSDEFLRLPVDQLIGILADDNLNIQSEEIVFEAAMRWIRADRESRLEHLAEIMQHVRLCRMSPDCLVKNVGQDPLIRANSKCRDYVDEAKDFMLLPAEHEAMQNNPKNGKRFQERKPYRVLFTEKLYSVGGWVEGDAIDSVEKYDPDTDHWTICRKMSDRRCGVAVAAFDDKLYAVGGHDGTSYLDTIEVYDHVTNEWLSNLMKLPSPRTSVGIAALGDYLYVMGGQEGPTFLDTVVRCDPKKNLWYKCQPMNNKRLGPGVATLNGCIYVVGGADKQILNTVECYDPTTDKWTFVASMSTKRKHLGCVAFNGMIYAVGGRDDTSELDTAERYDPRRDRWEPITSMSEKRSGVGLEAVNGKLYAVGGYDGQNYKRSVEVYDPATKHWQHCEAMSYKRLGAGVAVLREKFRRSFPTQVETTGWATKNCNMQNEQNCSRNNNCQRNAHSDPLNGNSIGNGLSMSNNIDST